MITVPVDEKTYALWLWKGDYWNLQNGAEIGLYEYSDSYSGSFSGDYKDIEHYHAVGFELPMSLSLYKYSNIYNDIFNIFSWSPMIEQWWCTGFSGYLHDADIPKLENMVSVGKIDFSGYEDIFNKLKERIPIYGYEDSFIFDSDNHTVWIMWR